MPGFAKIEMHSSGRALKFPRLLRDCEIAQRYCMQKQHIKFVPPRWPATGLRSHQEENSQLGQSFNVLDVANKAQLV